ncbi:uncharacterized protein LOC133930712 [Phragmites australis]|uniref:uncharacterized protein LOC133930712 n=1 Tax=Phragmites australis TaxID=29695 RepID=UPI002D7A3206|nr:uncharacterized protein LOC133930712 [Phragmites australis]XP_062233412.1 uncharacterized protein LOC133930712 [Phragmites australis]
MEVDDDVEEDDMDFNPFLREGSPSETSSSLTSEAECEEHSYENQPSSEIYLQNSLGNENTSDSALPQNRLSSKGVFKENFPEKTSTQVNCEHDEGRLNGLEKEVLPSKAACSLTMQNSHHLLLKASEEDAICRRTRARYSLANYSLEELETFLQESDDDGDLQNVDEEEEYRKFLAAVLSGGGDDTQACQGDENQDEDENDADFELEIEEALESDGDENAENYEDPNCRKEKDGRRPQTRQREPFTELSGPGSYCHESTKAHLRPILPYIPPALLTPAHGFGWQYPSQNALFPSSLISVTCAPLVSGFTDRQLGELHVLIYEHVQLLIQTFSLCVLDPSKQDVANNVKKMIVELVGCRDQALATSTHRQFFFESQHLRSSSSIVFSESSECQWVPLIKCPVISILDVSPLQLALGYLSDVATAVAKYRRSHVDGTADRNRRKEPLFPSPVINSCKGVNNVSQDRSNSAPTASSLSTGQLQQKKSLASTLIESTKKETVALVPSDIARLAQKFFPLFNFSLFPHKPPPAAMANRVLFTDAEDRLLALGLQEYNNDWGAIQKRFLPCKSKHQIFVRQKNRSSSKAPDNPVKEVRRMKTSPLTIEEIECIREGLRIFKNDWTSVWRFVLPHRDPSLLQRQWRVASGVQKSYSKSEAAKEKRRSYEAKRRKLRASMPDSRVAREQEADNNASDGVENDDDSYVNEAFLEDTDRSMNMTPCQLSLSRNAGKSMIMQSGSGTSLDEECGATGGYIEPRKGNGTKVDVTTSYIPFISCTSDGPSSVRAPCTTAPKVSCSSLDQLQASRLCKEKSSCVVKLAPDLPPVNLPPSVRVISQVAFHQNATHFNGTSDSAAKDVYPVQPLTFTESAYRQLNLFPDHSSSSRLQQNGISNENNTEDGAEQDFQMHPLLFQYPRDVLSSCSHPVQNLINHSRKYDRYPFEKVQVERSNSQTTGSTENRSTVIANTIDFHPLLQRTEVEMHDEVPEDDYHHSVTQSECNMRKAHVDDQSTAGQASKSPCERENNIDLNINLCSPAEFKNANDFRGTFSKLNVQDEGSRKETGSVSELEVVNACSHHCIQVPNEESMQGIVMEQEELSDSEEDSEHVEFECEEMDDSEEEQVLGVESSLIQNKGTSASVVCGEFHGSNGQSQIQQGLVEVGKQDASSMQKLQGSSRSARAKLKPETAKSTGSRANQRLSTSLTGEPSRTKTRSSKMKQGQSSAVRKSSDSRRTRKIPAPS